MKVWSSKIKSGRGLLQSKTLPRWLKPHNCPPGFGLRQPSAALFGLVIAVSLITGCAHFQPQPLVPEKSAAQFDARRLDDPGLKKFLEQNLGRELNHWPQQNWSFQELTLVAFYFHPSLEVARSQWRVAEAGI